MTLQADIDELIALSTTLHQPGRQGEHFVPILHDALVVDTDLAPMGGPPLCRKPPPLREFAGRRVDPPIASLNRRALHWPTPPPSIAGRMTRPPAHWPRLTRPRSATGPHEPDNDPHPGQ